MPDPALITPLGQQMLAALPRVLRGSNDYMAVVHAAAREVALLEASIETVRSQFVPSTADVLLNAWEAQLKLPVGGPVGATTASRRQLVLSRLQKVLSGGTGSAWEQAITNIVGAGWSYLEHDPANPASPPDGVIQITVPYAANSSQFIQAQEQIRDLTDGHLEINMLSSVLFQLDVSPMDSSTFGA